MTGGIDKVLQFLIGALRGALGRPVTRLLTQLLGRELLSVGRLRFGTYLTSVFLMRQQLATQAVPATHSHPDRVP